MTVSSTTHVAAAEARHEKVQLRGSRSGKSLPVTMSYEETPAIGEANVATSSVAAFPLQKNLVVLSPSSAIDGPSPEGLLLHADVAVMPVSATPDCEKMWSSAN